ncbi:MAG TPA: S8 family serine peptidase, partial [Candidatus Deferrimicrobium sp.]|nr:S8 family serine peptidase [Candidatus Deferrimicrobium sp.]
MEHQKKVMGRNRVSSRIIIVSIVAILIWNSFIFLNISINQSRRTVVDMNPHNNPNDLIMNVYQTSDCTNGIIDQLPMKIKLSAAIFDPLCETPNISQDFMLTKSSGYYIVQFYDNVFENYKKFQELGVKSFNYIPDNSYICKMSEDVKYKVERCSFVRWVGPFHPAYKVSPKLSGITGPIDVIVVVFPDSAPEGLGDLIQVLKSKGAEVLSKSEDCIIVHLPSASLIKLLAFIPYVYWIEAYPQRDLIMNTVREYTGVNYVANTPSLGFNGSGILIANYDTGCDWSHNDFNDSGTITPNFDGQIADYVIYYGDNQSEKYPGDADGHGTCVAGILAGLGIGDSNAKGMAPGAKLYIQEVNWTYGIPRMFIDVV